MLRTADIARIAHTSIVYILRLSSAARQGKEGLKLAGRPQGDKERRSSRLSLSSSSSSSRTTIISRPD